MLAAGSASNDTLSNDLKAAGMSVHVIGDAFKPRKAIDAVLQGFQTGYAL